MRTAIGHLPDREKVLAWQVALCLPFSVGKRPLDAFRAQQGHNRAQYRHPWGASRRLAGSPQQPLGCAFASAGVRRGLGMNVRPEPSLSPRLQRHDARRHGIKTFPSVIGGWVPGTPAFLTVMDQAGSGSAPRRKSQTSLTNGSH
jgi:hypothetical protein